MSSPALSQSQSNLGGGFIEFLFSGGQNARPQQYQCAAGLSRRAGRARFAEWFRIISPAVYQNQQPQLAYGNAQARIDPRFDKQVVHL